ncbi:pyridoxal 5'-phosphate synthase glutaminase subunit PdxT [Corynebacterium sp. CCM 8835]|uniref:Pyridoxal 5'-phosphate synthase subunit PdxT n=1 Tax=Corynebacterium antarcticum TaxID=2800405 RepID=A0ABS1FKR5_9CORY|nr:pyridoxal 5'-phosphate synthase glutaminase subunit PdxT [Corynebacterium antarcticum]MCK7641537.1 pyridoxal 5'-phosphate synthase glutaminase subunit PdxT [Corynebacterium antarcticum]MCK7660365.1 pyridoxal 5'-phosphate synthase glutaminase subunit PdxT [Corynebacterium antarcticum]MCL0244765.1 pyridoxal 5'-phosphate synthase glutaminase subunit PdxT [Corynebacterium antarcticum]MCX7539679.1 pyridoxal 5'-phosphate synthase glutaminase subunit PdxT [Corynebacterium antarcticum]
MIGILALQGGVREHEQALDRIGVEHRQVRRIEHLGGIDGLILPGGESTTMSKLLELGGLLEPLRELLSGGLPVYGTCAGMILLAREVLDTRADAHCFGVLDVTVRRNAFGRQVDSFETDLDFSGIADPVHAVFIRAPWVERVGSGVEVLAVVPDGPAEGAVVAVRSGNALATSFHPECTGDTRVHELFRDMVAATI